MSHDSFRIAFERVQQATYGALISREENTKRATCPTRRNDAPQSKWVANFEKLDVSRSQASKTCRNSTLEMKPEILWWAVRKVHRILLFLHSHRRRGPMAQWLMRRTTDQEVRGSNSEKDRKTRQFFVVQGKGMWEEIGWQSRSSCVVAVSLVVASCHFMSTVVPCELKGVSCRCSLTRKFSLSHLPLTFLLSPSNRSWRQLRAPPSITSSWATADRSDSHVASKLGVFPDGKSEALKRYSCDRFFQFFQLTPLLLSLFGRPHTHNLVPLLWNSLACTLILLPSLPLQAKQNCFPHFRWNANANRRE